MEYSLPQNYTNPNEIEKQYGTFWLRVGALLIDGLITLPFITTLTIYNITAWKSFPLFVIIAIISPVYKIFFEYKYGSTPGKNVFHLKVVDHEFKKATFSKIIFRNIHLIVFGIVSFGITFYIFQQPEFALVTTMADYTKLNMEKGYSTIVNFFTIGFVLADAIFLLSNRQSRSLHDKIGNTYVVKLK